MKIGRSESASNVRNESLSFEIPSSESCNLPESAKYEQIFEALSLGVKDAYGKCGNYKFMLEKHRLTPEKIVEDILYSLKN